MEPWLERCRVLVPAMWAGLLLCIAAIATPAPFATLTPADAGKVVGRVFAQEAYTSLGIGVAMLLLERRQAALRAHRDKEARLSVELLLVLGALFCTIAGYFALQPLMATARAGQGALSFGQLHAVSVGFFALKILLVLVLAARASRQRITPPSIS
jgi:hypothetical protein